MSVARKNPKMLRKDQSTTRDDRRELEEDVRSSGTKPAQKHPNRDRARGDWDRSKA